MPDVCGHTADYISDAISILTRIEEKVVPPGDFHRRAMCLIQDGKVRMQDSKVDIKEALRPVISVYGQHDLLLDRYQCQYVWRIILEYPRHRSVKDLAAITDIARLGTKIC
jgi:hypothetical protein